MPGGGSDAEERVQETEGVHREAVEGGTREGAAQAEQMRRVAAGGLTTQARLNRIWPGQTMERDTSQSR
eukprot:gene166-1679_t